LKYDGRIQIGSAGLLYGLIPVGASLLSNTGMSAFDISFFFFAFSVVPLLPLLTRKGLLRRMLGSWRYLSLYSLSNTGLVLLQFESLKLGLAPATSAFLIYTQPVWTIIFGKIFFSEKVNATRILVIVLAITGVFLITDPITFIQRSGSSANNPIAEIFALIGAIFLSLWIILGKKGRLDVFKKPEELLFAVRGSAVIPVGLISLATLSTGAHVFLASPSTIFHYIVPLFAYAIVAGSLPDYLFYSGIEKVQAFQAGVILLFEPISAIIISVILSIATPSPVQVAGGALILLSNYFVNRPTPGQRIAEPSLSPTKV
jgi:drug/metabolite transporter, DME family